MKQNVKNAAAWFAAILLAVTGVPFGVAAEEDSTQEVSEIVE